MTISGKMMFRTEFQNAKTWDKGWSLPSSWGLVCDGMTGGRALSIVGGTGGGGGKSDSIVASDCHEFVAETRCFARVQAGHDDAGVLRARGVQEQRGETEPALDGPVVEINVLQAREREELVSAEPNAAFGFEHFAVDAVTPCLVRARRVPDEQDHAKQQKQLPADGRPEPALGGEANADHRDGRQS